jgi:hypothetical protein
MNISDSRICGAVPRRAVALATCIGSLVLPACIDMDDIADDISDFSSTAQIPPLENAVGTRRIPLSEGANFDAMTFAPEDHGYGPNQFYYLRHDVAQANAAVLGTISAEGTTTDRLVIGDDAAVRAFATEHDALSPVVRDLLDNSASSTGPR